MLLKQTVETLARMAAVERGGHDDEEEAEAEREAAAAAAASAASAGSTERAKRAAKRLRVKAKGGEAWRKRRAEDDKGSVQEGMRTRAKVRRERGGEGTGGGGATRGGERETP